jgi:hypothetical protein
VGNKFGNHHFVNRITSFSGFEAHTKIEKPVVI